MATTAAPYGFRPISKIGGTPYAGSTRLMKIASGYATNIFYGDAVKPAATGVVERDAGTTTMTPVGIFMGCTYTDPTSKQLTFRQYWPTGTVASDAYAYVVDDPFVAMQIQSDEAVPQTALFANAAIVNTAGSTTTGNSAIALDGSTVNTTSTLPLRIVDFVIGPTSAVNDTYTDVIVMWNFGTHQYLNATGT